MYSWLGTARRVLLAWCILLAALLFFAPVTLEQEVTPEPTPIVQESPSPSPTPPGNPLLPGPSLAPETGEASPSPSPEEEPLLLPPEESEPPLPLPDESPSPSPTEEPSVELEPEEEPTPVAATDFLSNIAPDIYSANEKPETTGEPRRQATRPSIEIVPETRPPQRTALHQALGTSDVILQSLTGVRGVLASPLAPRVRHSMQGFRLGPIILSPEVSVGIASTTTDGRGRNDGTELSAFFQGRVAAIVARPHFDASLIYALGLNPSGGRDASTSGVDQQLALNTNFTFPQLPRMRFGFGLDYAGLSGIDRDTGRDTRRNLATASFTASYQYSRKTSFDWDVTVPFREFEGGISSAGLTSTFFVNNRISRKTSIGLGLSVGGFDVDGGPDQIFEQPLLRLVYQPSRLIALNATGGLEFRQAGDFSATNPIFGLGARWTPREGTSISLAAEERVVNSASVVNTNYTSTSVVLSATQRFSHRLSGTASLGYEHASYDSLGVGGSGGREDDLLHASVVLTMQLQARWSTSLTLSASDNSSDVSPFRIFQATLQTSYSF